MLTANASRLSRMYAAWDRFWFTPADPTVLGAIRFVTGVIALYTMIAYSYDLHDLIGANAWMDLNLRASLYRDGPLQKITFDWSEDVARSAVTDEEKSYYETYQLKHGSPPPGPYPRSAQEAQAIDDYMAHWGIDPRTLMGKGRPLWSVWFHVTDPTAMAVVHGGFVLCSFLFAIGCGTRLTAAITWFATLCYIHRAPASVFGADTMINILLMYLTIGPSGAALSVDRLIAGWRAKRQGLAPPALKPMVSANLAVRLIQIHACIIYLSAGLSKLQGQMWWTGLAPWFILANFEYSPMNSPLYVTFLRDLAKNRLVFETATAALALGTLVFEIAYPFVIWRPSLRKLVLWMAVGMHAGIGLFMGLKTFAVLMLAFNLAFVAPESICWAIDWFLPKSWRSQQAPTPKEVPSAQGSGMRPEPLAAKVAAGLRGKNRR